MRPYTRSLDPQDYAFLPHAESLRQFEQWLTLHGVPHREWCEHRLWEYASMMQQLEELQVPKDATIIDLGSGGSFFPPYLATLGGYPNVSVTDSMKYGDVTPVVEAQRHACGIALPLYDLLCEDMSPRPQIGWGGESDHWDVTMCISTIEHVDADQHDAALREMCRITKPGGLMFITSDYFRDLEQFAVSPSKHLQFTPYMKAFVLNIPSLIPADFVPNPDGVEDLEYRGDFIHHAYSFCNVCLRKRV